MLSCKANKFKEASARGRSINTMAFLSLRDIKKSYFLGKEEFPVLKGIDLDFELGEFVSILGESGGGKSTLMNIIGGLDRNFNGSVTINGTTLDHSKEKQMDEYRRGTIGYIYQSYNLVSHLTVLENVLVSLDMTTLTRAERTARAKELLTQVGLADQIKKHPNQLSGGQKQRVAIARALAADPQIIIADEPTGALDSKNTKEVLAILDDIAAQGKLVIAVTHSQEVADYGTRIVHLADGQIDGDTRLKPAYPVSGAVTSIPDKPLPASASYSTAWRHLKYNWKQNGIIILGTAIGLFAVLLFSGLGNGVKSYINDQVTSLANPTAVSIMRNTVDDKKSPNVDRAQKTQQALATDYEHTLISQKQLDQIAAVKHVKSVEPAYQFSGAQLTLDGHKGQAAAYQTWTDGYSSDVIKSGHKPGNGEILIDKSFAETITSDTKSLIGKKLTIEFAAFKTGNVPVRVTQTLTVSGIADGGQSGPMFAANFATMKEALSKAGALTDASLAEAYVDDVKNVKAAGKAIDAIKTDDGKRALVGITIGSLLDTINTIVSLASNVLAAIAGISLLVSALMIIATMYMSVAERTKEIGILRALGESKKDIRRLFTSESVLIGLISAGVALILVYVLGVGLLNSALYKIASFNMIQITTGNIIFAVVVALVIAYLAALLPSRMAARLNPIDALSAD